MAMEYVQKISMDKSIDIEFNSVINYNTELSIEYFIERLEHDYNLGIEYFISPSHDFSLDIELFIGTVSKAFNFEIDVLDLVYYFIRKGYNIIPWNYSDGRGNWDSTINKNWNKMNTEYTTFANGFINQINDKNLTIPNIINYSDKKQENFGCLIKDINNTNLSLSDKFLYYENVDNEYTLVMGKRKREPSEIVYLSKGENLIIWDGIYKASKPPMFNEHIKPFIEDKINNVQFWDQRKGTWTMIKDEFDHPLYFEYLLDGSLQSMPFVMNINVTDDCSFEIKR
jgi:hypothetical protein